MSVYVSALGLVLREALRWKRLCSKSVIGPYAQQLRQLRYQLKRAEYTEFGKKYGLKQLLKVTSSLGSGLRTTSDELSQLQQAFASQVPVFTYEKMYEHWGQYAYEGRADVCWPGRVTNFALSSGTSQASSKRIPVTEEMLQRMRSVGVRQLCTLIKYRLPLSFYCRQVLFLNGDMSPKKESALRSEGDISAITAQRVPNWFRYHYRPAIRSREEISWEEKLDKIIKKAASWRIAALVGTPTWVQLLLERVIDHYKLSNIHDIWPDLQLFVHGGVAFDPYKEIFSTMLSKPLTYLDSYAASEGFIAYQAAPGRAMELALDAGLFYEFAPFLSSEASQRLPRAEETCALSKVEPNKPYQLIISSFSGLWRYTIGDVLVFRNLHPFEVSIVGRTQHYLSLCGEHLCLDNMEAALAEVSAAFKLPSKEFTVFGKRIGERFTHIWHIGVGESRPKASVSKIAEALDAALQKRNADYCTKRSVMLTKPQVKLLPNSYFHEWLKSEGKFGGQHKFPRVLRDKRLQDWLSQLSERSK